MLTIIKAEDELIYSWLSLEDVVGPEVEGVALLQTGIPIAWTDGHEFYIERARVHPTTSSSALVLDSLPRRHDPIYIGIPALTRAELQNAKQNGHWLITII